MEQIPLTVETPPCRERERDLTQLPTPPPPTNTNRTKQDKNQTHSGIPPPYRSYSFRAASAVQAGFRRGRSTMEHLATCHLRLLQHTSDGKYSAMLCADLSRAFDRVNHRKLLQRLGRDFGVRGRLWNVIRAFLGNPSGTRNGVLFRTGLSLSSRHLHSQSTKPKYNSVLLSNSSSGATTTRVFEHVKSQDTNHC